MTSHRESMSSPSGESDFEDVKLSCDLCRAVFSGSRPYEQHLKGSAHKKAVMKAKYRRQHDLAKKALAAGGAVAGPLEGAASDDDEGVVYTCVACQKVCSGHVSYELHLAGRLHRKQLRRVQLDAALEKDPSAGGCKGSVPHDALYDEAPELKPYAGCKACGKTFSGPEAFKGHLESGAHRRVVRDQRLLQELRDGDAQFRKPDDDGDDDDDEEALPFCPDCGKIFSGPLPYRQHMLSDAHKRQVRNLRHLSKVKDLVVQVEGEAVFRCADCGSSFSGPKPFRQHLRGHGHQKSLRKVKVMDDIRARFPEVVEQQQDEGEEQLSGDSQGEEEGEVRGSVLSCGVCHKAFSGPENAREHFTSRKHLNAVREKKKIDRILQKRRRGKAEGAGPRVAAAPPTPEGQLEKKSVLKKGAKAVESGGETPDSDEEFEQILFPKH